MQRLTGFKFPRQNHQGLTLRKTLLNFFKENNVLHEDDDITDHMIPETITEET
jgi:hypothetical protein